MLRIKLRDIQRATLPVKSGNEGWIGVSPRGDDYHVVVPVDVQIARGVMACNLPTDGTPFGGYAGWLYFRCPPYEDGGQDEEIVREQSVQESGERLISWLASYQIDACIETSASAHATGPGNSAEITPPPPDVSERSARGQSVRTNAARGTSVDTPPSEPCESSANRTGPVSCPGCGMSWNRTSAFLRDPTTRLEGYRACLEDFGMGRYLFEHDCGSMVEVSVARFARPLHRGRSLIGTHACPGLCYYERSLLGCSAKCEGAHYRQIARKLKSLRSGRRF